MKSLLTSLVLILSTQVMAAQVELGKYTAVDADTRTVHANLELRADGTLNFKVKNNDFTMPEPGCEGKYAVVGNELTADMKCPTEILPTAKVKIDITNVNADSLRSEKGAEVYVVIDAFGDEKMKFFLKKDETKK